MAAVAVATVASVSYVRPVHTMAMAVALKLQDSMPSLMYKSCHGSSPKGDLCCLVHSSRATAVVGSKVQSDSWAAHGVYVRGIRKAANWTLMEEKGKKKGAGMRPHSSLRAAVVETTQPSKQLKTGTWQWSYEGNQLNIHYVEHSGSEGHPSKTLLLLPSLSDVSTTEEWQAVAETLVKQSGSDNWRAVVVDWPGLGLSDRPPIEYTVDVLEKFLIDLVLDANGPLGLTSEDVPVIIGGGHAATIAARALSKGAINAQAIAAVAPTWAGPLPIVFGRSPTMETRYGLLRGTLRSPGMGWAMYKYLVSSPKNIRLQYLTHVYADADNVTAAVVENRTLLTQREGARFAPAAFLTGLLDPVRSREEFLSLFAELEGKVPVLVLSSMKSPRRSRAEMEALRGAKGVTKFVEIPGALLPQEEYPDDVATLLIKFLNEL
jgi:pimeloyl-ACP methyl ester carboxylesterase